MTLPRYEEWRLVVNVPPARTSVGELVDELRSRLPQGVDLHRKGRRRLRLYSSSRSEIEEAEAVVRDVLSGKGIRVELTQTKWNPQQERWQSPLLPVGPPEPRLPESWAELGQHAWEVRLRLERSDDAERLARRLESRGAALIRNGRRVTVGVDDEATARQVAGELRLSAPTAEIEVREMSRWRRWLLEQRLVGNYGDSGGGGGWSDTGWCGDGGGGGNGGGGGDGGG